jgi:predicted GIY-YIG superfamily endonuclease
MDMLNINTESRHGCYLLQSLKNSRTYFGYTVDIDRRLRQHNGEIVGGAKKTKRSRPWKLICHITGFLDERSALQFEWCINHHPNRKWSLNGRIEALSEVLFRQRWTKSSPLANSMPLVITWKVHSLQLIKCPIFCLERIKLHIRSK